MITLLQYKLKSSNRLRLDNNSRSARESGLYAEWMSDDEKIAILSDVLTDVQQHTFINRGELLHVQLRLTIYNASEYVSGFGFDVPVALSDLIGKIDFRIKEYERRRT